MSACVNGQADAFHNLSRTYAASNTHQVNVDRDVYLNNSAAVTGDLADALLDQVRGDDYQVRGDDYQVRGDDYLVRGDDYLLTVVVESGDALRRLLWRSPKTSTCTPAACKAITTFSSSPFSARC